MSNTEHQSRTEQSCFRERHRYVVDCLTTTNRARVQTVCDEYWHFAPEIEGDAARGKMWSIEADEGFGGAIEDEGPDDWIVGIAERVGPNWLLEVRG